MGSHGLASSLQSNDFTLLAQHRANLLADVERRLAVAKAAGNQSLQALLEGERQQLKSLWDRPTSANASSSTAGWDLRHVWQQVWDYFQHPLQVEHVVDKQGHIWWYACDHHSGKTLFAETEADVIKWIEDNRLGY